MSQVEILSIPGRTTLSCQCFDLAGASVGTSFTLTEGPSGRYRGSTPVTGMRYIYGTGSNGLVFGYYCDLDAIDSNGYSRVFDTFEEAENNITALIASIAASVALLSSGSVQAAKVPSLGNVIYYNDEANVLKTIGSADYTALSIKVCIEKADKTDVATIPNESITKTSNSISFVVPTVLLNTLDTYRLAIRKTSDSQLLATGLIAGYYAPYTP